MLVSLFVSSLNPQKPVSPSASPNPQVEYSQRLAGRMDVFAAQERRHVRIGNAKLLTIVVGLAIVWLAWGRHEFSPWWIAAPALVYLALAIVHERTLRARARADRAAAFYRRGIARIEDRWAGSGETGEIFRDDKHVYSGDLDLFGRGSLFELLSNARTPMGEARLAVWLAKPSDVPAIVARQEMVGDLRDKLDLRERLAVLGAELRPRLEPEALARWSEAPPRLPRIPGFRVFFALLSLLAAASAVFGLYESAWWPLYLILAVDLVLLIWLRKTAEATIESTAANAEGLLLFAEILKTLEDENFASAKLRDLIATLRGSSPAQTGLASTAVRRLSKIVSWIDAREGLMARLLELPMLYTIQVAYAAESWRRRNAGRMSTWIQTTGEVEALLSLAAYAFEHPADPFPEFVDTEGGAILHGEDLGHPLIPSATCVRNSVRLDQEQRVLLVSGSNMSGKSTFLRTVGINAVLAMAGAPIRGTQLTLTPLAVGTRLRTPDSLQEGRSGFYSEVLRIKLVFDMTTGGVPVLFLFDELLEGTNSKDRKIGAEGLLSALLQRGAIGIITTHDLALTAISVSLGSAIHNAHFQDYVENGQMRFDYTLRDGVVAKSNAIALMRLIGLDV